MEEEMNLEEESFEEQDSEGVDQEEAQEEDLTDWKAEALKWQGIAKRFKSKAEKAKEEPKGEGKKIENTGELDYGQLAFLGNKGYESDDEIAFIKSIMDKTGMELKDVVKDDYVVNRIKSIREEKTTQEAIPSSTRRTKPQARDTVDYWLSKGQMPPDPMLAREVLNARLEKERQKSQFSDNPVISNL